MGFHIFPHLFLICLPDRCQTTIPCMEKHKTKNQSFISSLVLFRNIPRRLALIMPQACAEAQGGTCPWDRSAVSRGSQKAQRVCSGHRLSDGAALCLCKPDDSGW